MKMHFIHLSPHYYLQMLVTTYQAALRCNLCKLSQVLI